MGIPQRKFDQDLKVFKERRADLAQRCPGSAFVIPARREFVRNGNVHHAYRQDSNFYYLTGFDEPESVMVFRPGLSPELTLFVRPKDATREVWNGFRYGPDGAKAEFGADATFPIEAFEQELPELLKSVERVYAPMNVDREFDLQMLSLLEKTRVLFGRSGRPILPLLDPNGPLGEMRSVKSEYEINQMRKACRISALAHRDVMKACRPGVSERALLGVFLSGMMKHDAAREGYGTIVAAGANATCLHYTFNDQVARDGDLLLIDAGAEYNYYTGDITRTYPINGKFTDVQKRFYQHVLDVQKNIVAMVKPGVPYAELQKSAVDGLTDAMIELGLIQTSRDEAIESGAYRKYYPHSVSHMLGMDVHDVGPYVVDGESRPLEPGMVLTIEPGLYVPYDDESAPSELRGLGVRIEDDVLVTRTGHEVMTIDAPKEIRDLEEIVGKA